MSIHETRVALDAETAEALFDAEDGTSEAGWTRLADQHIDTGRWMERRWLVVSNGAGAFGVRYQVGLTEEQETELPWEESDVMELVPLVAVPVTTTKYLTERQYEAHLAKEAGR